MKMRFVCAFKITVCARVSCESVDVAAALNLVCSCNVSILSNFDAVRRHHREIKKGRSKIKELRTAE